MSPREWSGADTSTSSSSTGMDYSYGYNQAAQDLVVELDKLKEPAAEEECEF